MRHIFIWFLNVSLSALSVGAADNKIKNIDVEQFDKMRKEGKAIILDVRTPKEFAAGHIQGATNIDWNGPNFAEKVGKLDPTKTYLVHCAAGRRSEKACEKMTSLKITNCFNLTGGFTAWEKAGKPVEK